MHPLRCRTCHPDTTSPRERLQPCTQAAGACIVAPTVSPTTKLHLPIPTGNRKQPGVPSVWRGRPSFKASNQLPWYHGKQFQQHYNERTPTPLCMFLVWLAWSAMHKTTQANLNNQDPHFGLWSTYGCAKLHFTDLAQALTHEFGGNVRPLDGTEIDTARANL